MSGENSTLIIPVPAEEFRQIQRDIAEIKNLIAQPKEETLLFPDEAMELLRIKNYSTLWRWEKEGKVRRIDVNGRPRYRKSDILALMEKRA